jgi:periplasmic protein TonB
VTEVYSLQEVARAAGVSVADARAFAGRDGVFAASDAVRLGRMLVTQRRNWTVAGPPQLFTTLSRGTSMSLRGLPLAVSGSLHAVLFASIIFLLGFSTSAATIPRGDLSPQTHLVFLATPGPGGGGGGGGAAQPAPPPKAEKKGREPIATPIEVTPAPAPIPVSIPKSRPLAAQPLPSVVAPIVSAPYDDRDRAGLLAQVRSDIDSGGPGRGGGAGTGSGTGIGEGDGSGIGPGSGGGTGGGPYRGGSGITPPRVLKEVKADYTEVARQRALTGEVVVEIVVRRDGSVGEVRLLHGLGSGLDDRAIAAVRQWRFAPAERLGVPVDVIVEVGVEFRLR